MGVETSLVRELPVAAASGVVRVGDRLFVIADDEHRLAVLNTDGSFVALVPFSDVVPPADVAERKRAKPDLEALALAGGALVGIGSGSTPRRRRGFTWRVDPTGELAETPEPLDLGPLYDRLERDIPDLNIEGATVAGDRLLLFQRGNGPAGVNAVASLSWRGDPQATLSPDALETVERHDLGTVADVRLGFTDASCTGSDVIYTAVAEAAESTYDDGPCVGAAIGVLGGAMHALERPLKIEGVEVVGVLDGEAELVLVVDDDDPATAAQLVAARIPLR